MSQYCAAYYILCEKFGQVASFGNKAPFVDFAVKPAWINHQYASGKITYKVARIDLVRCCQDAKLNVSNLDWVEEEKRRIRENKEHHRILQIIMSHSKPFRTLPEVEAWKQQYDPASPRDRYKFLVLEGPSQVGKTRFVQSTLVDRPAEALVLDCADAVVPALKGNFVREEHKLVMFDEAHAAMIIRCKKLFQANINPTSYGSSPTNAFLHTVWLHGVKLVVGSNVWRDELEALPAAQREWIQANSVYIYVDEPLWIE